MGMDVVRSRYRIESSRRGFLAGSVAGLILPTCLRASDDPPAKPDDADKAKLVGRVARVVVLHNREREKDDLPALVVHEKLVKAAARHAQDMDKRKVMSHTGSDDSTPFARIRDAGYIYKTAGENVAYGRLTPERLMKLWIDSPPHKRNILDPLFSEIGAACAVGEDGATYWCVTFGRPRGR